ncbi:unnamed protein product [Camellia sinensis]
MCVKMGMKLYGIPASTCTTRVMACLYEKGVDFKLIPINMGAGEHKQPAFLNKNVRRGADRAEIYSLAFSLTAQWLAVSSDKGTVHVFGLKANLGNLGSDKSHGASDPNHAVSSPTSSLSFIKEGGFYFIFPKESPETMPKDDMKGVLPKYFSSEWSVAQFRLLEGSQYIVAFGHQKNTVVILGLDGSFYRCQFDPVSGGEMT